MPGTGYPVDWDGVWQTQASGVSIETLVRSSAPKHPTGLGAGALIEDILENRINSTQVVLAAILDLLTSQCDRHPQNVFVNEDGDVTLIDNDQVFGHCWKPDNLDSMFIPTTEKHSLEAVGFPYMRTLDPEQIRQKPSVMMLLDYRCHADGGVIGTDYPPSVTACMKRIRDMSAEGITNRYNMPSEEMSVAVKGRATAMLEKGFEWAVLNSEPKRDPKFVFPWQRPCCNMTRAGGEASKDFSCATGWAPEVIPQDKSVIVVPNGVQEEGW
ncbi:unnamed protein product [Ostreobium quekettii]|uniref:PI3K/PI4K catalytic domain-containing protein n=1 Tax=Ostreobium quekettii TaxID=121088 RepID=A0A8S1IT77_9CHLO|nr:unnamed protein product [Ostreobium quekettii]